MKDRSFSLVKFQSIYKLLLHTSKCRELRAFCCNFLALKNVVPTFFDKCHVWEFICVLIKVNPILRMTWWWFGMLMWWETCEKLLLWKLFNHVHLACYSDSALPCSWPPTRINSSIFICNISSYIHSQFTSTLKKLCTLWVALMNSGLEFHMW